VNLQTTDTVVGTISILREEARRLDLVIASLETLERFEVGTQRLGRRGRKFMSAKERKEVSIRMKRYWAGQRGAKTE
jgi:hypothetical protein